MSRKIRCDGTLIPPSALTGYRRLHAFLMDKKNDASVYFSQTMNVGGSLSCLAALNKDSNAIRITLFHVVLCAAVRTLALRPKLNRFVTGRKFYQRNRIQLSFVVKKQLNEKSPATNVKMSFSPYETLHSISKKIDDHLKVSRNVTVETENEKEMRGLGGLPGWLLVPGIKLFRALDYMGIAPAKMIAIDPMYTSAYVANLGSIGLDAPYHHLFEWGNASLFMMIGKISPKPVVLKDGSVGSFSGLPVHFTLDNRVLDGIYAARGIELFKSFIEDPEKLLIPPEIPAETLRELCLKDYPPA